MDKEKQENSSDTAQTNFLQQLLSHIGFNSDKLLEEIEGIAFFDVTTSILINDTALDGLYKSLKNVVKESKCPKGMGIREWNRLIKGANDQLDAFYGSNSNLAKGLTKSSYVMVAVDAFFALLKTVRMEKMQRRL